MCGIAGFLGGMAIDAAQVVARMSDALEHRGPDDSGVWTDAAAGIALAHRRLSILDLSASGHQPMLSASRRYVIVFNGEIYNHLELRCSLEGVAWRGHSDTETLLAACERWGVAATLERCVGMFAFALWDREQDTLILARDRLGEKPLYYGWQNGVLLFGSELKAIKAHPAFAAELDRHALALYFRHGYVPAPFSIFLGINKLPPGTFWQGRLGSGEGGIHEYWSARAVAMHGQSNPFAGSEGEAIDELERLLGQALEGQMLADVPLGAFLSGGVDSSAVVALMQARSSRPIRTFTIGFGEDSHNEAVHARAVAAHLGTEHTELYVEASTALAVAPMLPSLYDEPFADPSQIPTYLVAQLARQHVTVGLSGDGGDELFGGYHRYFWVQGIWRKLGWLPAPVRAGLAGAIDTVPVRSWNEFFGLFERLLPQRLRYADPGEKLHKLADVLSARSAEDIYWGIVEHWRDQLPVEGKDGVKGRSPDWLELPDLIHRMMYMDSISYLPDDILTKVDRASMGVSLETRVPMLDHRVFEFAWRLPLSMKVREEQGKWILRQMLYRHVPQELVERPKMGFGIPLRDWLRGPLREWAADLLSPSRLAAGGYLVPALIQSRWNEHQTGQRDWSSALWDALMFQAWHMCYSDSCK